jgi:hypothetical protein
MGLVHLPKKVKLITGIISADTQLFQAIKKPLECSLKNRIDFESETLDFHHTEYYDEEMGHGLKRKFLSFKNPVNLEDIFRAKIKTNSLERRYLKNGNRAINIDPGYVDLSKLVLFSTKDYTHRIYLRQGIYAEVTLFYKDKTFNAWPWTYPDYMTKEYIEIFNRIRASFKKGASGKTL